MQRTFIYYTDPGHGWVKVPVRLLNNIGIADKITSFSYYRNGFAFLERDTDMALLVNKLRQLNIEPKFKSQHTDNLSKIRNYRSFKCAFYSIKIDPEEKTTKLIRPALNCFSGEDGGESFIQFKTLVTELTDRAYNSNDKDARKVIDIIEQYNNLIKLAQK